MPNRLIAAFVVLAGSGAAFAAHAEADLFVGHWQWNRAESTPIPGGAPPKELILNIIRADPARMQCTVTVTDNKGQKHVQSFMGTGDGKAAPLIGAPPGTQESFKVTATAIETRSTSGDGGSDHATCKVSGDHKKLTCRGVESDGKGHTTNYVDVYDRR